LRAPTSGAAQRRRCTQSSQSRRDHASVAAPASSLALPAATHARRAHPLIPSVARGRAAAPSCLPPCNDQSDTPIGHGSTCRSLCTPRRRSSLRFLSWTARGKTLEEHGTSSSPKRSASALFGSLLLLTAVIYRGRAA
jgi:hypothetical protein